MRLLLQHKSSYRYPRPAALGPHLFRLRPASHARARIESYGLHISAPSSSLAEGSHETRWQDDPAGNHIARVTFRGRVEAFETLVEMAGDIKPVNRNDVDATPTSGTIYVGGGKETLEVDVRVEPIEGAA